MAAIDEFDTYILPENKVCALCFLCMFSAFITKYYSNFQKEKNKLVESLELFAEIQNNPNLRNKTFILFLNKVDIFKEKILTSNLIDHFEDFPGKEEAEERSWHCLV